MPISAAAGGQLRFERRGLSDSVFQTIAKDAYHFLRRATWTRLTLAFFGVYLAINLVFAILLWVTDARILEAGPSFWDRFFFSVETMATVGYGHMSPGDTTANVIATVEGFVGVFYTALLTGVVFGKFSTPSAKVMFAEKAVIADEGGVPTLMFRCANARSTALVDANVRVAWTRQETSVEGEVSRRIYDLPLRRSNSPVFGLSWTVYHTIDEASPLWGRTAVDLEREIVAIVITLTGIDDSLAASVHTRHSYTADHIEWGARYVDILHTDPDGTRYIDFTQFHTVRPAKVTLPGRT
jgi:inward rectifier potassium channel